MVVVDRGIITFVVFVGDVINIVVVFVVVVVGGGVVKLVVVVKIVVEGVVFDVRLDC